jgi:hypothetical protein
MVLNKDSTMMGYAVFLKSDILGSNSNFSEMQQSETFMNALFVHIIQFIMIYCVWKYVADDPKFEFLKASSLDMMIARFVASMMMHVSCERDIRNSI